MRGDSTQTGDEGDFKTAITHNSCHARIHDRFFLPFFPSLSAAVFISAVECMNKLNRYDLI